MSGSMPFDRAVEYYDATRGMTKETSRAVTSQLAGELNGRGRCLEIGVGTGLVALPLAEAGIPMAGLDLSGPMLARLVEKAGGRPPFPLVRGDATALPFADDRFGGAVIRHVLHLIPAWQAVVAELVRVVAAGGVVLMTRGDIPSVWRAATDHFIELVGEPSFSSSWNQETLDAGFAGFGAHARSLTPIPERAQQTLGAFLQQMADGLHSWTWEVEEGRRREAAAEVRRWAMETFGSLDPPGSRDVAIEWRVYDLP